VLSNSRFFFLIYCATVFVVWRCRYFISLCSVHSYYWKASDPGISCRHWCQFACRLPWTHKEAGLNL